MRVRYPTPVVDEEANVFCDMGQWLLRQYANRDGSLSPDDRDEAKLYRADRQIHFEMKSMAVSMEIGMSGCDFDEIRKSRPTASDAWLPIKKGWMRGRSLPVVVLHDPEKFYWTYRTMEWPDDLAAQAAEIIHRASRIRIPRRVNAGWHVTHSVDWWGRYEGFQFTRKSERPSWFRYFVDEAWLNLFLFCNRCERSRPYSAKMSESFFREFRDGRWDQARCDGFFSDESNFVSADFEEVHAIL